jgi:phosphatidylglycerophosphatase A
MIRVHKIIASFGGIGYIGKGGGTVAAIIACLPWYFAQTGKEINFTYQFIAAIGITIVGIWSSGKMDAIWGKDDKKVVIDEVAGMYISLLFLPSTILVILTGLILFRFFDIVKPLYIKKTEQLPGGWGVMMDDVLAGIYANMLLHIMVYLNWI